MKKGININRNITLENYIVKHWLPRKNHEVKISTYMRYSGLTRRIIAALGNKKVRDIKVMDIYSFYDDLREAKSEQITFTPNETCRRLLKGGYTRPETVRLTGMGMGTVDALRAGKTVSLMTAQRTSALLSLPIDMLFMENDRFLSDRTIMYYHRILYSIFKDAAYDEVIRHNLMAKVRVPKLDLSEEARYLDLKDAETVLSALNKYGKYPYTELLTLILFTGMRRGEACGLEWEDINFEQGSITVRRSSYYLPNVGVYTDTPKTKLSKRIIAINKKVINILLSVRRRQSELGIVSNRVFTYRNGKPLNPSSVTKYFHNFIEEHDLPSCCVHTLRHTNASLLIAAKTPITTVAGRLGHSTPEITLRLYAHQISEENKKAAEAIEKML